MNRVGALKGFTWLVSGRLGSAVVSIVSTAVLARLLTPHDFGVVAAAYVVLALANVIFDGAFGVNIVRSKDLTPADTGTTLLAALLASALLMLFVIGTAPLVQSYFGFPDLTAILIASSVTIPCKAICAVSGAYMQRNGHFRQLATAALTGHALGYIVVAIPLSLLGASVWTLVAAMVVAAVAEAIITTWLARMPTRFAWDKGTLRDIADSSLFSAANVMNWIANTSANGVIGGALSATALGYYSRAWKLLDLFVAATSTPLSRVLLPAFARHKDNQPAMARAFLDVLYVVVPASALVSVLLTIQAPLIVELALGSQWKDTIPVAQILFLALVPRSAFKVSEVFAVANGKSFASLVRQGFYAALMLGFSIVGVSHGVVGVAVGVSLAVTVFYVASMSYAITIGRISVLAVIEVHLRAGLLAAIAAAADLASLALLSPYHHEILAQCAAGAIAAGVAVLVATLLSDFFFGTKNAASFKNALRSRRLNLGA